MRTCRLSPRSKPSRAGFISILPTSARRWATSPIESRCLELTRVMSWVVFGQRRLSHVGGDLLVATLSNSDIRMSISFILEELAEELLDLDLGGIERPPASRRCTIRALVDRPLARETERK